MSISRLVFRAGCGIRSSVPDHCLFIYFNFQWNQKIVFKRERERERERDQALCNLQYDIPRGLCLAPNWIPMLEQRIDERTLNSVFRVSVKLSIFAVLSEKHRLSIQASVPSWVASALPGPLRPESFYGHSPSSADSRRAVVSYSQKNVHKVPVNCLGGLPRNSVVRVTDRAWSDLKCVEGP